MKIYGQFSDPANGPFEGHIHKLEYKHAVDTIRLKNDDLYRGRFFLQTTFFQNVGISLPRSLKLFGDDNVFEKFSGYILKFAQKSLILLRITESNWA